MSHSIKESGASLDFGLLLIRVVFALLLFYGHGLEKLGVVFGGHDIQFGDPIGLGMTTSFYLAAFAEGICTLFLILGLFSRYATIILTINFLVILYYHISLAGDHFAILESRFMYAAVFAGLIFTGPGGFSLDAVLGKRK